MGARLRPEHAGPGGAQLLGFGAYRPPGVLGNDALAERTGKSSDWVLARTGMATRRTATEADTIESMARQAAADALRNCAVDGADVDLVLVATCSSAEAPRVLAPSVAAALGAAGAAAFDLNAACAGFCYALAVASDAIRAGTARRALVIGAERMTTWVDPGDLGTSIIFGDGAGAALLAAAERPGVGPVVWGSDGSQADLIRIRPGARSMEMRGQAVFRWATSQIHEIAARGCHAAGVDPSELDLIVPHQANMRIVDALHTKLGTEIPIARDGARSGNTSAASIPLALHSLTETHPDAAGGLALLIGFGAGLTYATQVVRMPVRGVPDGHGGAALADLP